MNDYNYYDYDDEMYMDVNQVDDDFQDYEYTQQNAMFFGDLNDETNKLVPVFSRNRGHGHRHHDRYGRRPYRYNPYRYNPYRYPYPYYPYGYPRYRYSPLSLLFPFLY